MSLVPSLSSYILSLVVLSWVGTELRLMRVRPRALDWLIRIPTGWSDWMSLEHVTSGYQTFRLPLVSNPKSWRWRKAGLSLPLSSDFHPSLHAASSGMRASPVSQLPSSGSQDWLSNTCDQIYSDLCNANYKTSVFFIGFKSFMVKVKNPNISSGYRKGFDSIITPLPLRCMELSIRFIWDESWNPYWDAEIIAVLGIGKVWAGTLQTVMYFLKNSFATVVSKGPLSFILTWFMPEWTDWGCCLGQAKMSSQFEKCRVFTKTHGDCSGLIF